MLGEILSFDQEVPFFEIIDLLVHLIIEGYLVKSPSPVGMTMKLALKVNILSLGLRDGNMRDRNDTINHVSVVVDGVKSAFHKLASFQKVVDLISENSLAMGVTLNLEHELPPCHPVRDLQSLVQFLFVFVHQIKAQHESFLLQVFVVLKLEICDVGVLLF